MNDTVEYKIKELDLDIIQPNNKTMGDTDQGGSKIVVIGKPGTGKSTLIADILYNKRDIYPCAEIMSGTEDSNGFYKKIIPPTFIYNKLQIDRVEAYIKRQKLARKHLRNPWSILLLDDCTDDPAILRTPLFQNIFKNGRQWKMTFILSLQYCLDIRPVIRNNVDGTFILRESNLRSRKALHENYAGVIPDFQLFCTIMDQITTDYTALYIHNASKSNDWRECVFWYKAKPVPDGFKFGCQDYWEHYQALYNKEYVEPLV
jgi:GTPase SAR1 family protein